MNARETEISLEITLLLVNGLGVPVGSSLVLMLCVSRPASDALCYIGRSVLSLPCSLSSSTSIRQPASFHHLCRLAFSACQGLVIRVDLFMGASSSTNNVLLARSTPRASNHSTGYVRPKVFPPPKNCLSACVDQHRSIDFWAW